MKKKYEISSENKDKMISEIKYFFQKERDEDLGDLAASMILDFFIEKLADEFYNQGVNDSYKYMYNCIDDMLGLQKYK